MNEAYERQTIFLDTPLARESMLRKIEPKPQAGRSRQGLMASKSPQARADQAAAEPAIAEPRQH
jgi:hypothetical protein